MSYFPIRACYLLFLLLFAMEAFVEASAQELLQVQQGVFTDGVDHGLKTYKRAYTSPVSPPQISFWTLVRGTPELLAAMKNDPNGQVRIRHVWRRYVQDEVQTERDQVLFIGSKQDLQSLENQVVATGFFTWRTWSDKQVIPGDWRVDVLWENDEPVACSDANGERRDCSFPFQVQSRRDVPTPARKPG
ncbi:MAG: hypothetical protein V4508_19440 [Pseudomonadota bacterium]